MIIVRSFAALKYVVALGSASLFVHTDIPSALFDRADQTMSGYGFRWLLLMFSWNFQQYTFSLLSRNVTALVLSIPVETLFRDRAVPCSSNSGLCLLHQLQYYKGYLWLEEALQLSSVATRHLDGKWDWALRSLYHIVTYWAQQARWSTSIGSEQAVPMLNLFEPVVPFSLFGFAYPPNIFISTFLQYPVRAYVDQAQAWSSRIERGS